ncbi:MAG TPA: hypothetical protein PLG20_07065 [Candidatus Syntrophosphaera sp.]|nr:hypothetical protein [Candidatus Syntrophosphaera sp.]
MENSPTPPNPQTMPPPPQYPVLQPHRGILVLIFGVVGLVSCAVFGILAWIFGAEDLKKMDAGIMDPAGRDMTQAGKVLGIVAVCLNAIGILVAILVLVFMLGGTLKAATDFLF